MDLPDGYRGQDAACPYPVRLGAGCYYPRGRRGGLMLQGLELAGITDHTVKAVAGTVSRGVGNGGLQILDGHGDDDDTVDTAAVIDGQDARHIFIGTVLGNPRDFLTDRLLAIKTFLYRNMFIVQEDIFHTGPLIHAQTGPVIGVAQGAIPVDPENSCRDVFGDDVADLPVFNHLEVIFNGILHGHEQAEQDVIRQVILVQAEHGQKVSILSIHTDGAEQASPEWHSRTHISGPNIRKGTLWLRATERLDVPQSSSSTRMP